MPTMLQRAFSLLTGDDYKVNTEWLKMPKQRKARQITERELIRHESQIGAELFGQLPKGHRREFFNLDPTTWIWHEEWLDDHRKLQKATTRYEIHNNGILKVQEGARYSYLEGQELENLSTAIYTYYQRVAREIYHTEPAYTRDAA